MLCRGQKSMTSVCVRGLLWLVALAVSGHAWADFEDAPLATESPVAAPPAASPAAVATPLATQPQSPRATPSSRSGGSGSGKSTSGNKSGAKSSSAPAAPFTPTSGRSQASESDSGSNSDAGIDHNSSAPVAYSAQSLEGSLTQGRVQLKGDVEIEQGDAVMKSDAAEIFSTKGSSTPNRALAKGRVSLFKSATAQSAELRAVANELEYFISIRKAVLKGKPKIWRGRELLQGEVIEVFLDTNEIKVRGARGVMDPAANNTPPVGNPNGSGVQPSGSKRSSGQKNR